MFTGIITHRGTVLSIDSGDENRFHIGADLDYSSLEIGASVAHNGVCLTVIEMGKQDGREYFAIQASQETLGLTTMGDWIPGSIINLERALKAGDELGGHIVSGHVDGVGTIRSITPIEGSYEFWFDVPANLLPFIATKGSITVNGISLTVNGVDQTGFTVTIIPHTMSQTTLGVETAGNRVNLEIDMLARYVARLREFDDK